MICEHSFDYGLFQGVCQGRCADRRHLELGPGAGHLKWEFDGPGFAWPRYSGRVRAAAAMLAEPQRLFTGNGYPQRREAGTRLGPVRFSNVTVHEP